MRKLLSVLFAVFFIALTGLNALGSEKTVHKKKIEDIDDFFADYALVAPPEPLYLPIVMYHQISNKYSKLGTYVISANEFERDLKLFTDRGFTTITVCELIDFILKKDRLPEKPIMLTFDDGFQSDYVYAMPLLEKYKMKAIFSIVGTFTDSNSDPDIIRHVDYSHLSWDEVREMFKSGVADFQNHSYNMHDLDKRQGALPRTYESTEEYQQKINDDLGRLNASYKEHINMTPEAFTCPFGCYNDRLKEAVRKAGFSVIFTSYQEMNTLTGDPEELLKLRRYLRTHDKDMNTLVNSWAEYYDK